MNESPFAALCNLWISKIQMGWTAKAARFGKDAKEGMFFYCGPYDQMYNASGGPNSRFFGTAQQGQNGTISAPVFKVTINKAAELVQLYGPSLYYKNPNRKVTPRKSVATSTDILGNSFMLYPQYAPLLQQVLFQSQAEDKEDQNEALLQEALLNATPDPNDLKTESKKGVDECLIKGMGLSWTTVFTPPGSTTKKVMSLWDTCDNLVIDPDATDLKTATWISRRWIGSVWQAERKFGLEPGTLKGNMQSANGTAESDAMGWDGQRMKTKGETCDLIVYYEIWSKTGLGSRLKGATDTVANKLADTLAGDFAYLVVSPGNEFPLNAPPALMSGPFNEAGVQDLMKRFQWETPFYLLEGGWPCVTLGFHWLPNDPWPVSHLSFAMGELKAINWVASWLMNKVRTTCRDIIACKKALADEFKATLLRGEDLSLLEIQAEHGKTIEELVQVLQFPNMNTDIFKILDMLERWFDERTGLSELMYGMSQRQYRSAAEAEIKKDQANIRPDDMAECVEEWQSAIARHEAFASRYHLTGADVLPYLGKAGASLWQLFVAQMAEADPASLSNDFQYRVEAGSVRKPNRSRDAENANAIMQNLLPVYVQYMGATGDATPINKVLALWAKSMDIEPADVQIMPPPPPPMAPPMPGGPAAPPGQPGPPQGPPQGPPAMPPGPGPGPDVLPFPMNPFGAPAAPMAA